MLIMCDFNLNQPCGLTIVDIILWLAQDQNDFHDLLRVISKFGLRYLYLQGHVTRNSRPTSPGESLFNEPRQSSIFLSFLYFMCFKQNMNDLYKQIAQTLKDQGIDDFIDQNEVMALCRCFNADASLAHDLDSMMADLQQSKNQEIQNQVQHKLKMCMPKSESKCDLIIPQMMVSLSTNYEDPKTATPLFKGGQNQYGSYSPDSVLGVDGKKEDQDQGKS